MKAAAAVLVSLLTLSCTHDAGMHNRLINKPVSSDAADLADDARYYKSTNSGELEMHFFFPEGYDPHREEPYPVVVNFCGGGWVLGKMEWAQDNARFMSGLGFVGAAAEYRYADKRSVSVLDAMMDANSAVRWIRMHDEEFNIDPDRVAAMGDSAGGHLALCTAIFPQYGEASESTDISSVPNAVFTAAGAVNVNDAYFKSLLIGREIPIHCSPYQNVRAGLPPIYMAQCTDDDILPFHYTEEFIAELLQEGNTAELYPVPGGSHLAMWEDPEVRAVWENAFAGAVKQMGWGL